MCLYNSMVAPFTVGPMRVSAFVWYQGESNADANQSVFYACALPSMISSWRNGFASPDAFFGVVQLAPWWGGADTLATNDQIARVRLVEQVSILSLRRTACASAIDGVR